MSHFEHALDLYHNKLATARLPALVWLSTIHDYSSTMAALALKLGIRVSTLSEMTVGWAKDGVIVRITPASDMRSTTIRLTSAGFSSAKRFNPRAS